MYKVISKNGFTLNASPTLDDAMIFAKSLGILVTINGNDIEIVGVFGADSINNGKLPNGDHYTWYKRRYVKD